MGLRKCSDNMHKIYVFKCTLEIKSLIVYFLLLHHFHNPRERRKLIVPALKAYKSPPPHITTNINITYEINIIDINKPERSPVIEELFEEMLLTTRIMVTEEVDDLLSPGGEEEEGIRTDNSDRFDDKDKKTGVPKDQKKDTSVFLYLQLVAVPVVILLLAVLIYHIYKIKHPHKRTTFFRVSDLDPDL